MSKHGTIIGSLILILLVSSQCVKPKPAVVDIGPPVEPPKVLQAAIVVVDGVYNSELVAPMDVLQHTIFYSERGIHVFTVSPTGSVVTTFEGLRILPDYSFASDSLPLIDILVIPSAQHSMDTDLLNADLVRFVSEKGATASYVISLCDGAFVLAKSGLLDLHDCTTFPSDIPRFRVAFPQLKVHENVIFVHDRKMITSAGGARSYEPALYLVQLLYGKNAADSIAKGLVLDWDLASVPAVLTRR